MTRPWMAAWTVLAFAQGAWAGGDAPGTKPGVSPAVRLAQVPAPAPAARIEVLVLEASMGGGGIAPSVAHLPQLRQPPFAAYTQIVLSSRTVLPLGPSAATAPLPQGGGAAITSAGRNPDGRYAITVQFTHGAQSSTIQFVAAPGEPFFTVRSSRTDRALVLGFIVRQ